MDAELTTIYSAENAQVAELLRERLEETGIQAFVSDAFPYPPGESTAPQVLVAAEDEKAARRIAVEFEQQFQHREQTKPAPEPYQIVDDGWSDWPLCGGCRTRRQTMCPVCAAAGVDFSLADDVETAPSLGESDEEGELREVLLMCERCDEAFTPEFSRQCHACGHEHADGRVFASLADDEMSSRTMLVLLVLSALAIGMVWYFWTLFR